MIKILVYMLLAIALLHNSPSKAAEEFHIAAIVNNQVISFIDVKERIDIAISSSGLKNTPEIRKQLLPQIVQVLINEELQRQEAENLGIAINNSELARGIAEIEKQNSLPEGSFPNFVKKRGLKQQAVEDQLASHLLWTKIIHRKIRPRITIGDAEIEEFKERIKNNREGTEVFLSEVILPVANPEQEDNVAALAKNLRKELKGGADFGKIAKQFSVSRTAKNQGIVGWLPEADLDQIIRDGLREMSANGISEIMRTPGGYVIVKLHERRLINKKQSVPGDETIRNILTNKKADLEARKLITDLRRNAFIERRL